MADNQPNSAGTRQKVTIIAFVLVMLFLVWQVWSMFGSGSSDVTMAAGGNANLSPAQRSVPQAASMQPKQATTPQEAELMKQQAAAEAKYLAAVQELQMLKVQRDIAETNKAISTAKLDTVAAQTKIVDLLAQPTLSPAGFAPALVNPVAPSETAPSGNALSQPQQATPRTMSSQTPYSVISVTKLRGKWQAVIGNQSNLYNVTIGDVLPPDNSQVQSIDSKGVVLVKDGDKRRVSLVPII